MKIFLPFLKKAQLFWRRARLYIRRDKRHSSLKEILSVLSGKSMIY